MFMENNHKTSRDGIQDVQLIGMDHGRAPHLSLNENDLQISRREFKHLFYFHEND